MTEEPFPEELLTTDTAFQYVYPVANCMGWSTEQIKEAIKAYNEIGIEGSKAGTSLRRILLLLSDGSSDMISIASKHGMLWNLDLNPQNTTFDKIIENVANTKMRSGDILYMFDCQRCGLDFIDLVYAYRMSNAIYKNIEYSRD